ncbi:DUF2802 domain-containing protein [Dyella sp. 2HG41-7]|uniref:DUF2802 domain-containing protein n=1 Tax=Dyella sp. 2HG41-7 TaxID=2883239 RepID=UPI001F39F411|nr:DUF2802 domain-containing protein [Dyella sp. 2HG41-7]
MWRDLAVIAALVLQTVAIALLMYQMRQLKGVKRGDTGGVPELLIVNALNKIDHRLSALEGRSTPASDVVAPRRSVEVPATQMGALRAAARQSPANDYELAQQLAREGGDAEQLMSRCGLSRHEAELVLRLYAKRA